MRKLLVLLPLLAVTAAAFAAGPEGKWKGTIQIDMTKIPKGKNPDEQQMIDTQIAAVKKMEIMLIINANKTYHSTSKGGPMGARDVDGTWTFDGKKITMKATKVNGKAPTGPMANKTQTLEVSKDGKMITGGGAGGAVVFKKA